ncbi:hypothetical protein SLE2022_169430 [Rubroshorea leprosula]
MGNEMGNNNTSGLREEENISQEKGRGEATPADNIKEQNVAVPPAASDDSQDANRKEKGIGVGDHDADDRNLEGEEEETKKDEAQENSLQETVKTNHDDVEGDNHVVPPAVDGNSNGQGKDLATSADLESLEASQAENQKHEDKEEDHTKPEAKKLDLQETARADDAGGENCVTPVAEGEDSNGKETSAGSEDIGDQLDNMASEGSSEKENTKDEAQEKSIQEARNTCLEQSLQETASEDGVQAETHVIPAAEGEDCDNKEAVLASADSEEVSDQLGKIASEERSEQVKAEDYPPSEALKVERIPNEGVSEEDSEIEPASSKNSEDHQKLQDLNQDENLAGARQQQIERQNSVKKENEGTADSAPDAPVSASIEAVPKEHAGLKADEHQKAKLHDDESVQDCNGMQNSVDTVGCKENGHISYISISNYLGESVSSDPDEEVEKETCEFLVKEMASGEPVSSEEKLEVDDEYGIQNNSGNITAKISDLENGVGNKGNGETATKMDVIGNNSPESKLEDILADISTTIHLEDSKPEEKCIVLTEEIIVPRKESENGESKLDHFQSQSSAEPMEESKPDVENAAASEFMMIESDSENKEKDYQFEGAKMAEDEASEEQQRDTQKEAPLFPNPALIPADDFSLIDQRCEEEEEEPKEKRIIEEIGEKTDTCPSGNNTEITKERKEPPTSFLNPSLAFQAFSENQHQNNEVGSEKVQSSKQDSQFAGQNHESYSKFFGTEDSTFVTKHLMEENVVSVVDLAGEKPLQNISQHTEGMERLSSESSPDSINIIHSQMQKSPSFNLDLRINSRPVESDETPLLFQNKATIERSPNQADVPSAKPVVNVKNEQDSFPYEEIPVEEKVVALERSYSEKSRTPFLGFLKDEEEEEEEETSNLITPKKEENHSAAKKKISVSVKEVSSALTKGKEKRKHRPSFFFGTCMCCATV